MAVNLTEQGTNLAGFLTAVGEPLGDFIFSLGVVIAILGVVTSIIFLIKRYGGKLKI